HQADGDLSALDDLIAARYQAALPLLHIAGRDRGGELAAGLKHKNIVCARAVLYRAEAVPGFSAAAAAALCDAREPVEGVVIYSQRSADIFCTLYAGLTDLPGALHDDKTDNKNEPLLRPKAFCLSETIAATMRTAGFEAVAPPTPDSNALLAMICV
ncbi:MAG: uroporphyrinogen-III synthase, partial [Alphaproteobacteria bacterium]|nr:uroporphyrinogen-III synthase [Alphaproteobacteria bacterium]